MIEARIIEATDNFAKSIGVRFGTGAATAVANTSGGMTVTKETTLGWINPTSGFGYGALGSVSLPAVPTSGTAGSFDITLFNSKYSKYLDLEITALEADGRGKIISSPRVMTANQIEAIVEQGTEIPYQEASSSGSTSVSFKKANLSLKVKPQITPDGRITMTLDINKDTPLYDKMLAGGIPISTKHVKTEVLVENGGTVVIGGIYTQELSEATNRIPVLGDLPYLGWLFKNRNWVDDKTELLVFITPRIVAEGLAFR
jgi:type IV pilus assembly protein PilQ